jgi:uncharacterized protein (DUF934 family)
MPIVRNGAIIEDPWVRLGDDAPLPSTGDVIIPPERLKAEWRAIAGREGRVGVALPNDASVDAFAPLLCRLALVVLEFPAFTDGRAYSQARRLRTAHGYTGELRAAGNVLADQAAFMVRVGFDSFEVSDGQPLETWKAALESMSLAYQHGYDGAAATRYRPTPPARA